MRWLLSLSVLAVVIAACEAGGGEPPATPSCTTSADCTGGTVCLFAVSDGCSAQGQCGYASGGPCTPSDVCTCSGTTTSTCAAGGYVSGAPVEAAGACAGVDGGVDAGSEAGNDAADAGTDASGD